MTETTTHEIEICPACGVFGLVDGVCEYCHHIHKPKHSNGYDEGHRDGYGEGYFDAAIRDSSFDAGYERGYLEALKVHGITEYMR